MPVLSNTVNISQGLALYPAQNYFLTKNELIYFFKKKHFKDWLAQNKCSTSAHRKCTVMKSSQQHFEVSRIINFVQMGEPGHR